MKNMLKLSVMSLAVIGFVSTGFSSGTMSSKSAMDSTKVVTEGSKITIINENPKAVTLEITPVNSDSKAMHKIELQGKETKEYVINADMLGGSSVYNLKINTTAITGDTCKNLSVLKDYTFTLTNDMVGTTCVPVAKAGN